MPINFDLGITAQALQLRATRATLIANNLANADTPGYKAMDLDFRQVLSKVASEKGLELPGEKHGLKKTHDSHFSSASFSDNDFLLDPQQPQYRVPAQPALDGNSVDTQREKAEFAENQLRYEASVKFLDDLVKGYKKAFRGN